MLSYTRELKARRDYRFLQQYSEDLVTSYFAPDYGVRFAPRELAAEVFMETGVLKIDALPDVYGFHALARLNPRLFAQLLNDHGVAIDPD